MMYNTFQTLFCNVLKKCILRILKINNLNQPKYNKNWLLLIAKLLKAVKDSMSYQG